ncbi:MAG: efflux RND transporter periplasmic adaptor subunit [Opitutaceae bacterium]|nr:efflux RND transporter periplasmic adaptor subunit [Opitutaceae bacterium]
MARLRVFHLIIGAALLAGGCSKHEPAPTADDGTRSRKKGDAVAKGSTESGGGERPAGERSRGGEGGRSGGGKSGRGGGGGQPQAVEVINVMRRDLSESLNVVGSIAPNESATIRPEMSGLIRSIHFDEGQRVRKGDVLVKIDDSELRAQLAQTEARHNLAKLNLERADNLRQTQSNTQADVDRARSEFVAAQAEVALLRIRLQRTDVKAPFDGTTAGRTLSVGDNVNPTTVITTISDLSRLKVEFQVPERYISKVRAGTKFAVKSTTLEAPKPVEGEVYFVNAVADRNTRSSEVKGLLENPPAMLRPGTFATIELILEVKKGALTVPEGAILVDQRGPQVVVVRDQGTDKVAAFIPVVLGMRARGLVEVSPARGQLTEKDIVVGAGVGSLQLFQGGRLEPRPLRAEFRVDD